MGFSSVLFDCDGVLVDSEIAGLADAIAYAGKHGFAWTAEGFIRQFTGMRQDGFARAMREEWDTLHLHRQSDLSFEQFFDGFVDVRRSARSFVTEVAGATLMLERVFDLGARDLAVASSSTVEAVNHKVDRFGFRRFFGEHVYSGDQVALGKPEPDVFLHAASQLGVEPSQCLIVEDSVHGVVAGIAAGAEVWGFVGGGHCLDDHPDRLKAAGAHRVLHDHAGLGEAIVSELTLRT